MGVLSKDASDGSEGSEGKEGTRDGYMPKIDFEQEIQLKMKKIEFDDGFQNHLITPMKIFDI